MILSSLLFDNERIQISKIVIVICIKFVNIFLFNHFIIEFENSRIINIILSTITFDVQSKIWKRNHSNTKYFFVIKNSNSHFFFYFKFIRTRNICFSFVLKFIRTRNICFSFIFCIFVWSHRNNLKKYYNRDFRIWQIRFNRNVCENRRNYVKLTIVFKKIFFNDFLIKSFIVFVEFRWYYNQNFLWICFVAKIFSTKNKIYCFVLNVDFYVNDLIESNYYKINVFKNAFRRRWKIWLFRHLI